LEKVIEVELCDLEEVEVEKEVVKVEEHAWC
jgi:hypothetical protein